MNKESLEVINAPVDAVTVEYEFPKFYHRILANLIDIIIFVLMFFILFIPTNMIVTNLPAYAAADATMTEYRQDSGLFKYSANRKVYELIVTWYINNDDVEYPVRVIGCEKAIFDFQEFVKDKYGDNTEYQAVIKDYDDSRLSDVAVYEGFHLFVTSEVDTNDDGVADATKIIRNPEAQAAGADSEVYFNKFYRTYILQNCNGYLITLFPDYYASIKTESNFLFFCEVPVAFFLSGLVSFFLPGLIFRRGRMSFGKALYHIGLVDSRILSPTFWRFLARFSIFFFGELVLSFFTFGIPFIISFSMMAFSKKKQGFPDYLLGLTEVDGTKAKIYFTKYEAGMDQIKERKKPLDFKMKHDE